MMCRRHIQSCAHCIRFKQPPELAPMEMTETSYPLELVHMDFLTIGSKKGPVKEINVLVSNGSLHSVCPMLYHIESNYIRL